LAPPPPPNMSMPPTRNIRVRVRVREREKETEKNTKSEREGSIITLSSQQINFYKYVVGKKEKRDIIRKKNNKRAIL
jgi:hypothetical protein